MPKKGKGKKKEGKGKGKKDDGPPPPKVSAEEQPINELSRQFYMIQIQDLEGRVGRYQERCAALQVSNDELQKKLHQQEEDQGQVIQCLKKEAKDQSMYNAALEGELEATKQAKEKEKEHFEAQLVQQQESARRTQDKLQVENSVMQGQLEALEEFRENKEQLEEEARLRVAEIERLKKEQEEMMYSLEKKAVLDRDRMKKEMVSKVNSVANEFRKVSDQQMVETTKRTIRENVSISQQLTKMSEKTMALLRENEALRMKEKELSTRVELLESSNREVTKKNVSNQKVIVMLQEKVKEQEQELLGLRHSAVRYVALEREAREAMDHVATTTANKMYREHALSVEAELASVQGQLAEARKQLHTLTAILAKSAHTIQTALQKSDSEAEYVAQRQGLLATLLQLLNSAPHSTHRVPMTPYSPGDLGTVPSSISNRRVPPHNNPNKQNLFPVDTSIGKSKLTTTVQT